MTIRVLIVDDEPLIAESLLVYLQDEGMDVITADSGEKAVEIVRGGMRFDVCVMDMRLPGVDGNTSIKRLSSVHPDLKFVVHTGSIDYSVPDDLKHLGISESCLFQKPVPDMGQLADAIRALAR